MSTFTYDDGSTLTTDYSGNVVLATPATDSGVNNAVAGWSPSTLNPNAKSWDDVLKFGIARTIDAVTRPVQTQNTYPTLRAGTPQRYAAVDPVTGAVAISPGLIMLVGLALVALKLLK